ncbi:MAG: glycosyltransferase family 39 protein [Thermoguttaceae bacterium]|jgi:4-amino-4-deoxy-L-arabinose transferase
MTWCWSIALVMLLGGVFFIFPLLLAARIPLLDPDEGLHASIAQEMVEQGRWITPHFLGKPFLDKPVLYFWTEAIALRLFGMSEISVRLPGLLFGLLGALSTALLGARMFSRRTGLIAGLFYATTILPTALAQSAVHDVALVPWINLALLGFWQSLQSTGRREVLRCTLSVGVFLGLSILTKGLVGVALAGVTLGGYLLATRQVSRNVCLRGAVALGLAGLLAGAWYVVVEIENPGYLWYYLFQRHVLGFVTATQNHGHQPWWYYAPMLLGGGLPWIAYLPVTLRDEWTRWRAARWASLQDGAPTVLLVCWLVGCTLFLSAAHSKLVTYLWPVFPAVALLAAVAWTRFLDGALGREALVQLRRTFQLSCLAGPIVLPAAVAVAQRRMGLHFSPRVWAMLLAVSATAWIPGIFWALRQYRAVLGAAMLSMAAQFVIVMIWIMPVVATALSARDLARHFNQAGRLPAPLLLADERIGSLVFYLDPQLRANLQQGPLESIALGSLGIWSRAEPTAVVVLSERKARRIQRHLDLLSVACQHVGRHRLYQAGDLTTELRIAAAEGTLR